MQSSIIVLQILDDYILVLLQENELHYYVNLNENEIKELLKKGTKRKSVYMLNTVIEYIDKEIDKEMNRTLKLLPEISYILVGIALLAFIITILLPCIQIYLGGFLFI